MRGASQEHESVNRASRQIPDRSRAFQLSAQVVPIQESRPQKTLSQNFAGTDKNYR